MGLQHRALRSIVDLGRGTLFPFFALANVMTANHLPIALGLAVGALPGPAIAQDMPQPAQQTSEPAANEGIETYTVAAQFSLMIPAGWTTEMVESEGYAVITSYLPGETIQPTDVRTEVSLVNEPPETYVDREINALVQQNYRIRNYGVAAVGGNQAFRLWIIDRPGDFTQQVITFVGEGNRTSKIISYYNEDSPEAIAILMEMHQSFEFISDPPTRE